MEIFTAVIIAAWFMVAQFIDYQSTKIEDAICRNDVAGLRRLLKSGADPNSFIKNHDSYWTPLVWVANSEGCGAIIDHYRISAALLEHGADVNVATKEGSTPLMGAASLPHAKVVRLFISAGANVNAQDDSGKTALIYSAANETAEVAKILVAHGADVTVKSKDNEDALAVAKYLNKREIVEYLSNITEKQ
jgi:ankyrin repeat protein